MKTMEIDISNKRLLWIDVLKALALFGIILNHLVEEFYPGPWFTNPSNDWGALGFRLHQLLPLHQSILSNILMYLGWLGDSCPGVFILLSGFTLAVPIFKGNQERINIFEFYKKRLLRIFPLYILVHLIAFLVLIFTSQFNIPSKINFLSLFGLRFSDTLFYYINPSWWFIWLILQLYFVFPFLIIIIKKTNLKIFLIVTFSITILSRLVGILNLQHFSSMYTWMTGAFFGSRLMEFAMGVSGAYVLVYHGDKAKKWLTFRNVIFIASVTYLVGLVFSFTLIGSLLSNLLVTIGITGIFLLIWAFFISKISFLKKAIVWIGIYSFSVFLIHQFVLQQFLLIYHGSYPKIFAIAAIIISFPIGWIIDLIVTKLIKLFQSTNLNFYRTILYGLCFLFFLITFFIEPRIHNDLKYNLYLLFILTSLVILVAIFLKNDDYRFNNILIASTVVTGLIILLLMPRNYGEISCFLFLIIFLVFGFGYVIKTHKFFGTLFGILALILIFTATEFSLKKYRPRETLSRWGEYPALQAHSSRIYSLIPNKITHLKYNNYDYILKTNNQGLACPQIDSIRPSTDCFRILLVGDAFTMPEGLPYEDSYGYLLQKNLMERHPGKVIQVINGGVTGYGPNESLPEMMELAKMFKPNLIIYEFFINEFEEINLTTEDRLIDIGLMKNKSDRFLSNTQIFVHLLDLKEKFDEKVRRHPSLRKYYKSFLYYFEKNDTSLYTHSTLQKLERSLLSMKKIAEENRSQFLIGFVPSSVCVSKESDIYYFPKGFDLKDSTRFDLLRPLKYLYSITGKNKLDVLDFSLPLKKYPFQPVYFPASWHWNKDGHKAISEELVKYIESKALIMPN